MKEKFKKIDLKTRILGLLACFYVVILISFQQVEAVQELKDYEPAISIELKDGKKKAVKYLVKSTSLENVLNDLNIKLGEEDSINLKMDTEIEEGAKINITRVTYEEERVKEKIEYEIEYVDSTDPNLFGTSSLLPRTFKSLRALLISSAVIPKCEATAIAPSAL